MKNLRTLMRKRCKKATKEKKKKKLEQNEMKNLFILKLCSKQRDEDKVEEKRVSYQIFERTAVSNPECINICATSFPSKKSVNFQKKA